MRRRWQLSASHPRARASLTLQCGACIATRSTSHPCARLAHMHMVPAQQCSARGARASTPTFVLMSRTNHTTRRTRHATVAAAHGLYMSSRAHHPSIQRVRDVPVDAKPGGRWTGRVAVQRPPDTRGKAQVVRNDHGGVEALKVQHRHRLVVEAALGLHHQWQGLHRGLRSHLLPRRRHLRSDACLCTLQWIDMSLHAGKTA